MGRKGFAPLGRPVQRGLRAGRVSVLACGCVLAFLRWPCFGRAGRVSSLCGWPCFGRAGRVSVWAGRVGHWPGPCFVGAKPSCVGRKEPHISVTFTKFKNYDKRFPGHELKRAAGMTSWRSPATKLINMLSAYVNDFTLFETKQPPIGYDPMF